MVVLRTTSTGQGHSWRQRSDTEPNMTVFTTPRPREPTINKLTGLDFVYRGIMTLGSPQRICSSLDMLRVVRRRFDISTRRWRAVAPCGSFSTSLRASLTFVGVVDSIGSSFGDVGLATSRGTAESRIKWSVAGWIMLLRDHSNSFSASSFPS